MAIKVDETPLPLALELPAPEAHGWIAMAYYAPGGRWTCRGWFKSLDDAKDALSHLGVGWQHRRVYRIGEPRW